MNINDITKEINRLRAQGKIPYENYWIYLNRDCPGGIKAKAQEEKEEGYIGYFVEDDTRLAGILKCHQKRTHQYL